MAFVGSSLFASDALNVMTVAFHVPDTDLVSSAKASADICDGLTTHVVLGEGDRDRCLGLIFGHDPDRYARVGFDDSPDCAADPLEF
jgi:hypothetical protein